MQIILSIAIYFDSVFQLYFKLPQTIQYIYPFIKLLVFSIFKEGFLKYLLTRQQYLVENGKEQALNLLRLFQAQGFQHTHELNRQGFFLLSIFNLSPSNHALVLILSANDQAPKPTKQQGNYKHNKILYHYQFMILFILNFDYILIQHFFPCL